MSEVWSKIGGFFRLLFAGVIMVITFLVTVPFFILALLWNWVLSFIGLCIFWLIAYAFYQTFFTNNMVGAPGITPFTNTSIPILLLVAFIAAIMMTIGRMRE